MLSTRNLSIGYTPTKPLFHGINLTARSGEVTALLGANGAGKSTLLRTLCGEQAPLDGEVLLSDKPLSRISRKERAATLAIVATEATMTGALTVRQLVELGRQPYTGWSGILSPADREMVESSMQLTGIAPKASAPMATLSDGERQKAMIARALAQDTPLLLLDEPLSFLDPSARLEIFSLLSDLARGKGKAVILSCHDIAMSLRMASRLWLLTADGKVLDCSPQEAIASGFMNRLFSSPHVKFSNPPGDFIWTT